MPKYPMLANVQEARVDKVGGKAAILEEIVRRSRDNDVPPFVIFEDRTPVPGYSFNRMLRASSPFDVLGGFGLYNSFTDVFSLTFDRAVKRIMEPDEVDAAKIDLFAESIGRPAPRPTVMSQEQRKPNYWVLAMEHPNNPDLLLVNFSDSQSFETKDSLMGIPMSLTRDTYCSLYDMQSGKVVYSTGGIDNGLVELVAINFMLLRGLGLVHPEWVSIAEMGAYKTGKIETYQLTPVRRKTEKTNDIPTTPLIFGTMKETRLPVVNIPTTGDIRNYLTGFDDMDDFPEVEANLRALRDNHGYIFKRNPHFIAPDIFISKYIKQVEQRYRVWDRISSS